MGLGRSGYHIVEEHEAKLSQDQADREDQALPDPAGNWNNYFAQTDKLKTATVIRAYSLFLAELYRPFQATDEEPTC